MTIKADLLVLNAEHPDWTASTIAHVLKCSVSTVRSIAVRDGITLPSEHLVRKRLREKIKPRPYVKARYAGWAGGEQWK